MVINGAPTRTRTADLLITNQLLYQLSYRGTEGGITSLWGGCKTLLMRAGQQNDGEQANAADHQRGGGGFGDIFKARFRIDAGR